jgi:hypothetical protein
MTPDLDTDPLVLLPMAALLGIVSLALWLYERKHDERPHSKDDPRAGRAGTGDPATRHTRRSSGDAAYRDRLGDRADRRKRSAGSDRAARALGLTDDEVVAIARYLQLGWVSEDQRADLIAAINKTDSVARYLINADRAGRR